MEIKIKKITPNIGAKISGIKFEKKISSKIQDQIYQALIDNLVIFISRTKISHESHLEFAKIFGTIDEPHLLYPHVEGHENIVLLENNSNSPPDTNSWHTDLTFKEKQPFASVLVARKVPKIGGDTIWSSLYSAYNRLPEGMKSDLEGMSAIHDMGDFRNSFSIHKDKKIGEQELNKKIGQFGHRIRPLIDKHPVTGKKFLNFNEAFVTHIVNLTTNDSNSLRVYLANHMNKPEDQIRWHWNEGDIAIWDNRVTMHYALSDYLPNYRCMNRITVIEDSRLLGN